MNKNKLIFLFSFFLVVIGIGLINADKILSSGTSIEGYIIEVPSVIEVIEEYEDFIFDIHVVNQSTGYPITDATSSCKFHLYNETGGHQLLMDMGFTDGDFEITIDGNNFTRGRYSYLINCNDSRIGGFIEQGFDVTTTGFSSKSTYYFLIIILSFGVIIFGLIIKDAPVTILGTFGLYFFGLYVLFNGIDGIKDGVTTWAFGIIILGLAFYFSTRSAYELIVE